MPARIYLDNAATTPLSPPVLEAMTPYLTEYYGNASSVHSFGREARKALFAARETVARAINALPEEIYFTSGGTEADNWAVRGAAYTGAGRHIVTSRIEHHAVLHTCERLAREGFEITYLSPDLQGRIDSNQVRCAIRQDTALVTIMAANNEVGTLQPVAEIGATCMERGVPFHTDAVQAVGPVATDVKAMSIDMLSLSAHKLQGPKGIGALYVRKGLRIRNLIEGGAQEGAKRGGTENIPGIVGLAKAIEIACGNRERDNAHIEALRERLCAGILSRIPSARVNGQTTLRLPGILNLSFQDIKAEGLLLALDMEGVAASSGSACTSGSLDPSHVLLAMGLDRESAHNSLRLSIGKQNTAEEIDRVIEILPGIIERLRDMTLFLGENDRL